MSTIHLKSAVLQKEEVHKTLCRMRAEAKFTDLSFVTRRKCNGKLRLIDAHQIAFSDISETLTDMFRDVQKKIPNSRVYVTVDEVDGDVVEMLIDYIYGVGINVTSREWEELRKLCNILGISLPLQYDPLDLSFSNDSLGEASNTTNISESYYLLETIQELVKGLNRTEDPESHTIFSNISNSEPVLVQDNADSFLMAETQKVVDKSKNLQKKMINIPESVGGGEEIDQFFKIEEECPSQLKNPSNNDPISAWLSSNDNMLSVNGINSTIRSDDGVTRAMIDETSLYRNQSNNVDTQMESANEIDVVSSQNANILSFDNADRQNENTESTQVCQQDRENTAIGKLKNYICKECGLNFKSNQSLQDHRLKANANRGQFRCTDCHFSTNHYRSIKPHFERFHKGILKYKCKHCKFSTAYKTSLWRHIKCMHNEFNTHKCGECSYTTGSIYDLQRHNQAKHEGIKYECSKCEYSATYRYTLQRHKKAKHNEGGSLKGESLKCHLCSYTSSVKGRIKRHKEVVHEGVRFECSRCEYSGKSSGCLKRHVILKHGEGKTFKCDLCSYTSYPKSMIERHKRQIH